MTIKEILEAPVYTKCTVKALLQSKVTQTTKNGNRPYLTVRIADAESSLEFPIWDNVEERNERMKVGQLLEFAGVISEYQGQKQISVSAISILDPATEDMKLFIARYEIEKEVFDYFDFIIQSLPRPYKDFAIQATGYGIATKEGMRRWFNFTTCVAASKHHQNKQGGLLIHTVGVLKLVDIITGIYMSPGSLLWPYTKNVEKVINRGRLLLKAIVHDICKDQEYEFLEAIFRRKDIVVDHRIMFISFADKINQELADSEDMQALGDEDLLDLKQGILCHHGPWGPSKPKNVEDVILHVADMIDAKIAACAQNEDATFGVDFSIQSMLSSMERI